MVGNVRRWKVGRGLVTGLLASLLVLACGSDGGSAKAGVGEVCDDGTACDSDLFCYQSSSTVGRQISGLCTMKCDTDADCSRVVPNTGCLIGDVCGHLCGSGLGCPTGTYCNVNDVCIHRG